MEGSSLRKSKTVLLPDSAEIARLRAHTAIETKKLEIARKAVIEDGEELRVASRRKDIIESQLASRQRTVESLEWQVTAEIERCSARLLKPLLHTLETVLAPELREMVYGHLIDISQPKVIPEIEPMMPPPPPSMPPLPPSPPRIRRRKMSKHSPFAGNYLFDPVIMGFSLSREIKYFFITKTPFYFRGCQNAEQLGQVLRVHMPFGKGKRVRDVVRHLRVYLRCESHGFYLSSLPTGLPYFETLEDRRRRGERHMYDSYGLRLKALRDLPYDKHKIKLEICIFHDLCSGLGAKDEDDRHKYNLLETVKSTYAHAKEGGADVAVRYENFHTGAGSDVSWELDLDDEASSEREPVFTHDIQENTPARRAWLEKIATARAANPDRFSVPNISWKHALANGPFSACVCEACDKDKFRFSVDAIPVGVGTFPVNAFPVDAPLTSCNFGPDTLFPHTPEDFEFDGGDFDFSHVPAGVGDL